LIEEHPRDVTQDAMRVNCLKFHLVICLHLENAEYGFRENLLENSRHQEIAKNSDTKYLLVLG
jgi:hypothetical protein